MKLVKSLLVIAGLSMALSSCLVAGPGYYRPRPRYYGPPRPHYHAHPHYYGPRRY